MREDGHEGNQNSNSIDCFIVGTFLERYNKN